MKIKCTLNAQRRAAAREDIRRILSLAPDEVVGVRDALIAGRIEGSVYNGGGCTCLVGTIAKLRGITIHRQAWNYPLERAIQFDSERPAEKFFYNIHEGDTPETSGYARLALKWIDEWIDEQAAKMTAETEHVIQSAMNAEGVRGVGASAPCTA